MKRNILVLFVIMTLLLAACGAQASEPAEAAAQQNEATQEESAEVAADQEEAASEEAAATEEVDPIKLALQLADKAAHGENAEFEGGSGITVGVVMPQLDNDGWRAAYIGALSQAIEMDVSVITLDARNNVDTQTSMIQDLITKQVDAIVFVPVDSAAMSTAVIQANEAGIPVVTMDRSTEGGDVVALVESNNVEIGAMGAQLLKEAAEKNGLALEDLNVLELLGDLATSAGQERHEGFSGNAAELGVPVGAELPTYWDSEKANAAVLDGFQANPDINAIYMASGCAMYSGVESALRSMDKFKEVGEEGHIILISTDGCPAPIDGIRQGYVDADSAQQLVVMGQTAVEIGVNAVNGTMPESSVVRLGPDPTTSDNIDEMNHWANQLAIEY